MILIEALGALLFIAVVAIGAYTAIRWARVKARNLKAKGEFK